LQGIFVHHFYNDENFYRFFAARPSPCCSDVSVDAATTAARGHPR
jgi:hypothetical protein